MTSGSESEPLLAASSPICSLSSSTGKLELSSKAKLASESPLRWGVEDPKVNRIGGAVEVDGPAAEDDVVDPAAKGADVDEPTAAEDKDEDAVARDGPAVAGLVEVRESKTRCASGVTRRNIGEVVEAR